MIRSFTRFVFFCLTAILQMALPAWSANTSEAGPIATYEVHGVLKSFDAERHQALISHDAIPGYMPAMTMTFDVPPNEEMGGFRAGDSITFRLCVQGNEAWIEHLQKVSDAPSSPFSPAAPTVSRELHEGDFLPDIELVDQAGHSTRLSAFRGKTLALTFTYTRCPLPTYCPLISRNFESARPLLAKLGASQNACFVSVSLDPLHDTPESLAAYAKRYHAEGDDWIFATTTDHALHTIGDAVGLESRVTEGRIDHNLRTIVIDPTGRLRHIFRGNSWTPQELVAEMRTAGRAHP